MEVAVQARLFLSKQMSGKHNHVRFMESAALTLPSEKDDVKRLYDEMCQKEPKGIQILVNNAGIARDDNTKFSANGQPNMEDAQAISDHFLKSQPENWADTMKTNVGSIFWMSMTFLPLLAKGGQVTPGYTSQVINVSSISGYMKGSSNGQFSYASSKAAATHLSRMLATTFVGTKVRVNTIAPGVFPSEVCSLTPYSLPVHCLS
jgi:NAD(P)-dependent dehydrogenase (short-subunit alcohol dehydrogenase family)